MDDADKASMAIEKEWDTTVQVMTDVMPVMEEQLVLKRGCWVRLKRGIFKDDIAQVDYVDAGQSSVHLKLVPRIDYSRLRDTLRDKTEVKRKQCHRPPQKLFDMEAVRAIGGEISQDGGFIIFEGNRYSLKGLLYKSFVMSAIQTEDVKPTLSELEKFEEQPEDMDVELARSAKAEQEHLFTPGDNVEVIEGELINLQGTIVKIDGTKVTIMPKHEDLKDPLEFPAHDLKLLPQDLQLRTAVALGAEQNTTQKDVVKVDVKRPCSDAVRADLAAGDGSERGRGVWMDLERDSIDQTIQITHEPYKGGPGGDR